VSGNGNRNRNAKGNEIAKATGNNEEQRKRNGDYRRMHNALLRRPTAGAQWRTRRSLGDGTCGWRPCVAGAARSYRSPTPRGGSLRPPPRGSRRTAAHGRTGLGRSPGWRLARPPSRTAWAALQWRMAEPRGSRRSVPPAARIRGTRRRFTVAGAAQVCVRAGRRAFAAAIQHGTILFPVSPARARCAVGGMLQRASRCAPPPLMTPRLHRPSHQPAPMAQAV
jgi:hypothetical protein